MPLISILVPIYNVEKYLNECIDSVLKQSFNDYELILIDDGSSDNCGMICDHYAQKDHKIKVIHKQNSGVSEARNVGIDNSTGKYLMFLDGDDFLIDGCLELVNDMLVQNEKTDIFLGQSMVVYNDNTKLAVLKCSVDAEIINRLEKEAVQAHNIFGSAKDLVWSVWRNIYRRELIVGNKIYFDKELISAEDGDWYIKALLASQSILAFNFPLINYRRRSGSITLCTNKRKVLSELQVYKKWFDYFSTSKVNDKNNKVIITKFANLFTNQFIYMDFENEAEKKEVSNYIKQNIYIIDYVEGLKYRLFALLCRFFGVNLGTWCISKIRIIGGRLLTSLRSVVDYM